jgi:uncharacterized protein (TIGR02099 family)
MVIKRTFHFVSRWCWYGGAVLLVLLATYVSLGRYYMSYIDQYERDIEQWLASNNGITIKLDGLAGDWVRLSPVVTVDTVELFPGSGAQEPVSVGRKLAITVDVLASLASGRLQFQRIDLSHISLTLEEYTPKRWKMSGIPVAQESPETDIFLNFLFDIKRVNLESSRVELLPYQKPAVGINMLGVQLGNDYGFRRIKGGLYDNEWNSFAKFIVETDGDPRFLDQFTGNAYINFNNMKMGKLSLITNLFGVDVRGQSVTGEVWAEWQAGGLTRSEGQLNLPLLDLAKLTGKELAPLKAVNADFYLSGSAEGRWDLRFKKLNYEWYEHVWLLENIQFEMDPELDVLYLSLAELNLDSISDFMVASKLVPEKLLDTIVTLSPHGALRNLHINLPLSAEQKDQFKLLAELVDIKVNPWKGAPGGQGINGKIAVNSSNGHVSLDTASFAMDFPKIYHHKLAYQQARANVFWRLNEQELQVSSDNIELIDGESSASGAFLLDIPRKGAIRAPSIYLNIGLQNDSVEDKDKYLPYFLEKGLLDWLDTAISKGTIMQGGFAYRGLLKPVGSGARTVQLFFDVADATVKYQPDWPQLHSVDGFVAINDDQVMVTADKASVFESAVQNARVELSKRPETGEKRLLIDALINGPLQNGLQILLESPLKEQVGTVLGDWQTKGQMEAALDLDIPLKGIDENNPGDIKVDVSVVADSLLMQELDLHLQSAAGIVHYTDEQGLFADDLHGKLWGRPVKATISSQQATEVLAEHIRVTVTGDASADSLYQWLDQPLLSFAEGMVDYDANLTIYPDSGTNLSVHSNLTNVAVDLPPPFAKSTGQDTPLTLNYSLGGPEQAMDIKISDIASASLLFSDGALKQGQVSLAAETASALPTEQQLIVTGSIATMELEPWLEAINRYGEAGGRQSEGMEIDTGGMIVALRDLQIGSFTAYGRELLNLTVNLVEDYDYTRVVLRSDEIDGSLSISKQENIPHEAAFSFLHLDPLIIEKNDPEIESDDIPLESIDFSELPYIRLSAETVYLEQKDFGSWSFIMRPMDDVLLIDKLFAQIRGISIDGMPVDKDVSDKGAQLKWQQIDGQETTEFTGQLSTKNLKDVWSQWGYSNSIESKNASLLINSSWDGSPFDMSIEEMIGKVELEIHDGRVMNISKSTSGALRVLGILNFGELLRRVTSGFGYLYKKGMSFDEITGSFSLNSGLIQIDQPLKISSPSSSFRIEGDMDLNTDMLDMEMVATLPVGRNLPWIAAVVGGLPVAAGAYVANKLFEKEVGKLSSAVYTVKGSLSEPEVKFNRVFDTKSGKKKDSKQSAQPDQTNENPAESSR